MSLSRILSWPLYPFILGFYFIAFVFSENLGEVYLDQLVRPTAILCIAAALAIFAISKIAGSVNKAALIAAAVLVILFAHTGIHALISRTFVLSETLLLAVEVVTAVILLTAVFWGGHELAATQSCAELWCDCSRRFAGQHDSPLCNQH